MNLERRIEVGKGIKKTREDQLPLGPLDTLKEFTLGVSGWLSQWSPFNLGFMSSSPTMGMEITLKNH